MTRGSRSLLLAAVLLAGAGLFTLARAGASVEPTQVEQVASLREGNRLYREGRLEEAREAYLAGYSPGEVHPVLAYNLATTAHHLGRLPEAILWYRRAEAANPTDPWMLENLVLARASLGLQPYPAPGISGWISRFSTPLSYAGAGLCWLGLVLWIARPRRSAGVSMALFIAGTVVFAATVLIDRSAPRAAVVLEGCSSVAGDLPAGSEIWVVGETGESYRVVAGELTLECPREAIAPVVEAG